MKKIKILSLTWLLFFGIADLFADNPVAVGATAFSRYVPIEVSAAYTASAMTDIAVPVKIGPHAIADLHAVTRGDGADLMFTSEDGYYRYPHEVERWDADGTSLVWVRLPVLSQGTRFRMYYGNSEIVANATATACWKGYAGVWHLNGSADDSSLNAAAGILGGNVRALADGVLGGACGTAAADSGPVMINDASSYIDDLPQSAGFTVSAWVRLNDMNTAWRILFGPRNQQNADIWGAEFSSANAASLRFVSATRGRALTVPTTGLFGDSRWRKLDVVYQGENILFYVDGALFASGSTGERPAHGWIKWMAWGGAGGNGTYSAEEAIGADFDECRIASTALAADRIAAEYAVATADIFQFGEVGTPGDESGVSCDFTIIGANSGEAPLKVDFRANALVRGSETQPRYEWDFDGDGIFEISGHEAEISHVFEAANRHHVSLRVVAGDYRKEFTLANAVTTVGEIFADGDAAENGDGSAARPYNRLESVFENLDCAAGVKLRGRFAFSPQIGRVLDKPGFTLSKWGDGENAQIICANGFGAPETGVFRITAENVEISGIDFRYNSELQNSGALFKVENHNVVFRDCGFALTTRPNRSSYHGVIAIDAEHLTSATNLLVSGCSFSGFNFADKGNYCVIRPGMGTAVVNCTFENCATIMRPDTNWWSGEEMFFISNRVYETAAWTDITAANWFNTGAVIADARGNTPSGITIAYNVFSNSATSASCIVALPNEQFQQKPLIFHDNVITGYRSAIHVYAQSAPRTQFQIYDNHCLDGCKLLIDENSALNAAGDGRRLDYYKRSMRLLIYGERDSSSPADAPTESPWRVEALDPSHIVVKYDLHYAELTNFLASGTVDVARRATVDRALRTGEFRVNGDAVATCGSSVVFMGQSFMPDRIGRTYAKYGLYNLADTVIHVFLNLSRPLTNGETIDIFTPIGENLEFTYSVNTPTPLFKVNQVGYMPAATSKFAYLGGWMGDGGEFPLADSYPYELVNAADGTVVTSGQFVKRMDDPVWNGSVPLTGEKTLEADFGGVTASGVYYLRVGGLGRSMDFAIDETAMAEQFAAHAHGLFNQRCGCEKTAQYTAYPDAACHVEVLRGVHPSNDDEYSKAFTDAAGNTVAESGFEIISANIVNCRERLQLPGGWHDAADYDRRPFHLHIVNDLAAVYLMRPENFRDGQLLMPENNNGIPDVLDEADWGLRHLIAGQQADGGVGLWIETVRHPTFEDNNYPSEDGLVYCLARATKRSTLQYCSVASLLARALYAVGTAAATARADIYRDSAIRAWRFVQETEWQQNVPMLDRSGNTVYYNEPRWLNPIDYVKSIINLAEITRDSDYLAHLNDIISYRPGGTESYPADLRTGKVTALLYDPCIAYETLGRSAYSLMELGMPSEFAEYYADQTRQWRGRVQSNADAMIRQMNEAMAYRAPWYGPDERNFAGTSWGAFIPMRRGMWLCAAHYLFRESDAQRAQQYLDAAYLTVDFQSGCNPCGSTWTSGLGKVYPVKYLSLHSLVDGIDEYVDGITPYRNTVSLGGFWNIFNSMSAYHSDIWNEANAKPVWRRWENAESMTVAISEFTVWETVSPCAAMSGYLIDAAHPRSASPMRAPVSKMTDQPGYWALP